MKLTSLLSIILVIFSCNAQEKNKQKQNEIEMTTETFDIETFKKNKVNNEYNFVLDDGTKIRQYSSKDNFTEIISPSKSTSLFQTQKEYFKNGKLHLMFISFERNFIKSKKEYDETGKLIKEINYDIPFKFTFEQLLELLQKEKDTIDILDKSTVITRGVIDEGTLWEVEWKKTFGRRETLKVDGITGEVLERSFYPMNDN